MILIFPKLWHSRFPVGVSTIIVLGCLAQLNATISDFVPAITGERIGHECGVAAVYLRKPIDYYITKYHDAAWGLRKTYLLMEKQRNRGQDGAGVAVVKRDMPPGHQQTFRVRSADHSPLDHLCTLLQPTLTLSDIATKSVSALKQEYKFIGELYLGHVRYGTFAGSGINFCQPYISRNDTAALELVLAGNFNMTNNQELAQLLCDHGLTQKRSSDTQVITSLLSYHFQQAYNKKQKNPHATSLDIPKILKKATALWDGGYLLAGLTGNGAMFVFRDPAGIRPGFIYKDDEIIAVASERAALMTVFNVPASAIEPIKPGHVIVITPNGEFIEEAIHEPVPVRECLFERIYFSRVNDPAIYTERKRLGHHLAARVYALVGHDLENTIFSYIPNTSETAFAGMIEEICPENENTIITEKIIYKDQQLRTFITNDCIRSTAVSHVYDIITGVVKPNQTLVILDDSIVRGTTLRESIMPKLIALNPKKIIIVSSAPPILYPDCYGIDMSQFSKLIGFNAVIALLKEDNKDAIIEQVAQDCYAVLNNKPEGLIEHEQDRLEKPGVKQLYAHYSLEQLEAKIAQLLRPEQSTWQGEIKVIFQSIEGLHKAIPDHHGDWYFTGNYPTPGGYRMVARSFLNWYEGFDRRAY